MSKVESASDGILENQTGLSTQEQSEALKLKTRREYAQNRVENSHSPKTRDEWNGVYLGFIPAAIERAVDRHDVRRADKSAGKHYHTHEGAYQIQAIKDAAAEGVHTDFGTGNRLEGLPGLSEQDNQKAVNLRWQHYHAERHANDLDRRRFQSYHRSVGREINEMLEETKAHRRVKAIEREQQLHYKKHEGEYQIQAVNDAAAEGVETNFSEK